MAVETLVSVEEYLKTAYHPDCDYVDGVLEERNLGDRDHSRLTAQITAWFYGQEVSRNIRVFPEQRVQVGSNRFRVPDICVTDGEPDEQILTHPPLLCIEILSPEDRLERILERVEDYLGFGVPEVWVISPKNHDCWRFTRQHNFEKMTGDVLTTLDGRLELNLSEATRR
jgi:Uma2 family endonuclease